MKERIKKLLAAGMKASEIALTVGCSPSYVSQLLSNPEFKEAVQAEMLTSATENSEEDHLDKRYQILEHKILNNITEALPNADLPQLTRALEVVAKRQADMKKAKLPALANNINNGTVNITNISLPAHILAAPSPTVSVNENNEIIAIDSKPLAPLSSNGVKNIFEQMRAKALEAKAQRMKLPTIEEL